MGFARTDEEGRPLRFRRWRRQKPAVTAAKLLVQGILDVAEDRKQAHREEKAAAAAAGARGVDRVPERLRVARPEPVVLVRPGAMTSRAALRQEQREESLAARPKRRRAAQAAKAAEKQALRERAAAIVAAREQSS